MWGLWVSVVFLPALEPHKKTLPSNREAFFMRDLNLFNAGTDYSDSGHNDCLRHHHPDPSDYVHDANNHRVESSVVAGSDNRAARRPSSR